MADPELDDVLREALDRGEARGIRRRSRYAALSSMLELQTLAVKCARAKQQQATGIIARLPMSRRDESSADEPDTQFRP